MKKLLTALVITLSTAALAEQAGTSQAQQEQKRNEGRHISTGLNAAEVGPTISQKAKDVSQKVTGSAKNAKEDVKENTKDASEDTQQAASNAGQDLKNTGKDLGQDIKKGAEDVKQSASNTADKLSQKAGMATASQGTFKKDKAFSANGTLKNTGGGGVTLVRQGLPDANLDVRKETVVMLDGKKVDSSAIPEGAQVRARFQLEGEEIVAVELDAKSPKSATEKDIQAPKDTQAPAQDDTTVPVPHQ